jgi:hypothetical protein
MQKEPREVSTVAVLIMMPAAELGFLPYKYKVRSNCVPKDRDLPSDMPDMSPLDGVLVTLAANQGCRCCCLHASLLVPGAGADFLFRSVPGATHSRGDRESKRFPFCCQVWFVDKLVRHGMEKFRADPLSAVRVVFVSLAQPLLLRPGTEALGEAAVGQLWAVGQRRTRQLEASCLAKAGSTEGLHFPR